MNRLRTVICAGTQVFKNNIKSFQASIPAFLHTSAILEKSLKSHKEPKQWLKYNDIVYPPQSLSEERRPAEIVHQRPNIKYSQKKLYYIAYLIRGLSIDEAIKQLTFHKKKGAEIVKDVIEEARQLAIKDYNVEFRSNLWIESAFIGKAKTIKGWRKHARRNPGKVHYRYTHFFLRLREGCPPKHYYPPPPTGHQLMQDQIDKMRNRTIHSRL